MCETTTENGVHWKESKYDGVEIAPPNGISMGNVKQAAINYGNLSFALLASTFKLKSFTVHAYKFPELTTSSHLLITISKP
mmetsp:Transcript_13/g.18  ORF Transcript_13/g.18 Transcript_13/m.18 type:complete len:81 (+) Transcript_13:169-411(+)